MDNSLNRFSQEAALRAVMPADAQHQQHQIKPTWEVGVTTQGEILHVDELVRPPHRRLEVGESIFLKRLLSVVGG